MGQGYQEYRHEAGAKNLEAGEHTNMGVLGCRMRSSHSLNDY